MSFRSRIRRRIQCSYRVY